MAAAAGGRPGAAPAAAARAQGRGGRPDSALRIPVPRPKLLDCYVLAACSRRCSALAFVGLLGIFYISTFIDLSDKLFKGTTTGAMLLQYLYFATPQFVLLHHPARGAARGAGHDRRPHQEQRADRDEGVRHQPVSRGGAAAGVRRAGERAAVRAAGAGAGATRTGAPRPSGT